VIVPAMNFSANYKTRHDPRQPRKGSLGLPISGTQADWIEHTLIAARRWIVTLTPFFEVVVLRKINLGVEFIRFPP
jgi:hypothetical protein